MTANPDHELIVRRDAAQAVVDRFLRARFEWGRVDCGRSIVAPVLKAMGHACPLAPFGRYSSEFGARRALVRNGFASIEDYLDKRGFLRIGHASCLVADLVGVPTGNGDWLAIGVVLGRGRVFSFIGEAPEVHGAVVVPNQIACAWRIPALRAKA